MSLDRSRSFRPHLVGGALVVALLALQFGSGACAQSSDTSPTTAVDPVLADIRQETSRLAAKPRTVELTSEKALAARAAILRGDFPAAHKIVADVLAVSRLGAYHFDPFRTLMENITCGCDPALEPRLNEWVDASPADPIPLTVRAEYELRTAWFRRSSGSPVDRTGAERLEAFQHFIALATADAEVAMRQDAENPFFALQHIRILSVNGNSSAFQKSFKEAVAKFPKYYQLYQWQLWLLSPKWGGSSKAMQDFVSQIVDPEPPTSPLQLLRLQLYANLLDASARTCGESRGNADTLKLCIVGAMQQIVTPELENGVETALKLYNNVDKYEFSIALKEVLGSITAIPGGEVNAGTILQRAANATGSDNRMLRDPSAAGNIVLDELTGDVWYRGSYYDNAEKKYLQAVQDVATTPFPDEEERDVALAELYDRLAVLYYTTSQLSKIVSYTDAAVSYEGNVESSYHYYECVAYFKLHLYRPGIDACTALIDHGGGPGVRFWRGKLYQALGDTDAALRDYAAAADSGPIWGTSAAINMSLIYSDRKDNREVLRVLEAHPYLYDESSQRPNDLA